MKFDSGLKGFGDRAGADVVVDWIVRPGWIPLNAGCV